MKILTFAALAASLLATPALAQDSLYQTSKIGLGASNVVARLTGSDVDTVIAASVVPAAAASIPAAGAVSVAAASAPAAGASVMSAANADQSVRPLKIDDRVVIAPDPAPNAAMAGAPRR